MRNVVIIDELFTFLQVLFIIGKCSNAGECDGFVVLMTVYHVVNVSAKKCQSIEIVFSQELIN